MPKIPPPNKTIDVTALECSVCGDLIYSRARHDCIECSCASCFIDGGFDYIRVGFRPDRPAARMYTLKLPEVTKTELYDDWNTRSNQYGRILRDEKEGYTLIPVKQ